MPVPIPPDESRSAEAIRHQFEVERSLAERLRAATKEERRRLYGATYDEFFRQVPDQPQLSQRADAAAQEHLAALQTILLEPFLSPQSIFLEIGSGDGSLALRLASRLRRVYTLEASREIFDQRTVPENLELLLADAPCMALPDGGVDLAFSCHFVEHLHPDDLVDHLRDVRRVLGPGAPYVCVTPNRLLGPHDVSKYFAEEALGLHLAEYCHFDLAEAMRRCGFARVEVLRGIGRPPKRWPLLPYALAERLLLLLRPPLRRQLLSRLPFASASPFRPFEQVKLVATA